MPPFIFSYAPPKNLSFQGAVESMERYVAELSTLVETYLNELCDYRSIMTVLVSIKELAASLKLDMQVSNLADDGILCTSIFFMDRYLWQMIMAVQAVGESCQSAITPTWHQNYHIHRLLISSYNQAFLSLIGARLRLKYRISAEDFLSRDELYYIICLFWGSAMDKTYVAPSMAVNKELALWLRADTRYDDLVLAGVIDEATIPKKQFLLDISIALPIGDITLIDLFCVAHLFNLFFASRLRASLPASSDKAALCASTLRTIVLNSKLHFLDLSAKLSSMNEELTSSRLSYLPSELELEVNAGFAAITDCMFDTPSIDYLRSPIISTQKAPYFCAQGTYTYKFPAEQPIVASIDMLFRLFDITAKKQFEDVPSSDAMHADACTESPGTYIERESCLMFQSKISALIDDITKDNETASFIGIYSSAIAILEKVSFYTPLQVTHRMLVGKLPTAPLDLGIISVPFLAEYALFQALGIDFSLSSLILSKDNVQCIFGSSVFDSQTSKPVTAALDPAADSCTEKVQHDSTASASLDEPTILINNSKPRYLNLATSIKELRIPSALSGKISALDLVSVNSLPEFNGKTFELSSTVLKTAMATPIIVSRYIEREAKKTVTSFGSVPSFDVLNKITHLAHNSIQGILKACALSVTALNSRYTSTPIADMVNTLFTACEIPMGYEFFTGVVITRDTGQSEAVSLIANMFAKMVIIYVNTAFLCFSAVDSEVSEATEYILPFGGFACRLALKYILDAETYWTTVDPFAGAAFKGGANAIRDQNAAKAGYGSTALQQALSWRGLPFVSYTAGDPDTARKSAEESIISTITSSTYDVLAPTKRFNYFASSSGAHASKKRPDMLFSTTGQLPLKSYVLPLVAQAGCLNQNVYAEIATLLQNLKFLPFEFDDIVSSLSHSAEAIVCIGQLLATSLALTECQHFLLYMKENAENPSAVDSLLASRMSWLGGLHLSRGFAAALGNLTTTLSSAELDVLTRGTFKIVVTGGTYSGITSIIQFLTLQPLLQFSTPLACAAGDPTLFMSSHLLTVPQMQDDARTDGQIIPSGESLTAGADMLAGHSVESELTNSPACGTSSEKMEPWFLSQGAASQETQRVANTEIHADKISVGSWLSSDNEHRLQQLSPGVDDDCEAQQQAEARINAANDEVLVNLVDQIRSIQLTQSVVEFYRTNCENDDLVEALRHPSPALKYDSSAADSCYVQPPGSRDYSAGCDGPVAPVNDNNLYVELDDKLAANGVSTNLTQPESPIHDTIYGHDPSIFSLEAVDYRPAHTFINSLSDGRILRNTYVSRHKHRHNSDSSSRVSPTVTLNERFMQEISNLPKLMYAGLDIDIEAALRTHQRALKNMHRGFLTESDFAAVSRELQEQLNKPLKRKLPSIDFTRLQYSHSLVPRKYGIDLLSVYNPPRVEFFDIPGRFIEAEVFLAQKDDSSAEREAEEAQAREFRLQDDFRMAQQRLIGLIKDIHEYFQKPDIPHQLLAEQRQSVANIVNATTRQLQPQYVSQLGDIVRKQAQQVYSQVETNTTKLAQYLGAMKDLQPFIHDKPETLSAYKQYEGYVSIMRKNTESLQSVYVKLSQEAHLVGTITQTHARQQTLQKELASVTAHIETMHVQQARINQRKLTAEEGTSVLNKIADTADAFIFVYDCTGSTVQLGVQCNLSCAYPNTATDDRYSKLFAASGIYQRLKRVAAPGIIVCNKIDMLCHANVDTIVVGMKLAEALSWPHVFVSAATGTCINNILRPIILQKIPLIQKLQRLLPLATIYESDVAPGKSAGAKFLGLLKRKGSSLAKD